MSKAKIGNFFEDFSIGQKIRHATPRTVTEASVSATTARERPSIWNSGSV